MDQKIKISYRDQGSGNLLVEDLSVFVENRLRTLVQENPVNNIENIIRLITNLINLLVRSNLIDIEQFEKLLGVSGVKGFSFGWFGDMLSKSVDEHPELFDYPTIGLDDDEELWK